MRISVVKRELTNLLLRFFGRIPSIMGRRLSVYGVLVLLGVLAQVVQSKWAS
jgi:hypothetical protein